MDKLREQNISFDLGVWCCCVNNMYGGGKTVCVTVSLPLSLLSTLILCLEDDPKMMQYKFDNDLKLDSIIETEDFQKPYILN